MTNLPELTTSRLRLRPFTLADAPAVARYCGEWEIAKTTSNIPHPYDQSMAEAWIETHRSAYEKGEAVTFAITIRDDEQLVGAIGLHISKTNRLAEIGYWIGRPFWGRGYATEAVCTAIGYAYANLELNRIQARHMTKNPASGRVMEKAGMTFEGILRQSLYQWGAYEDAAIYSILREEVENKP